ncbi:MAG: energy-coupling factor transporter ATPase [Clostridiales bacterium]|uniref:Energy-coupling factor transporter ATP-binding protein EcfA2 n=1 Tax=Candidatus Egerieisoma faecipullorum TaxID=2840963 RepID=A0A9D1L9I5_9CLOT|nr:energy-coupling factor transporter ATPase [Clostridiales bacterium]PWM21760.1 MAG: energy-coupling factor transporter ATPase [Clostridiales bacterium]HIU29979.1 energy-coupling factor transporter ATPase [Candidatus Egerieisoma faecipullorum]
MSLKVEALSYTYMKGTPFEKKALDNVTFEIETGEFVGIIGHTGCGKSTLVQHFNGLLKPEEGNIYIDGKLMNHSNIKEMRKQVGLVFQYPEYQLFESTVYKDIAFGIRSEGLSHEEEYRRVLDAAEKTGLSEDLLENSIYDLSGGQKRRAAIAGIIVMNPEILVLDEPAAGLDPAGRDDILQFAKRLRDDNGITVILVSHSMEDIAKLADKVIVLNEGKLEMMGTPREVFRNEQRLNQIGLTVPQMTSLFHRLGGLLPESGIRKEIFTVEEGAEEILRLLGIRRGTGGTDL